jgi:hypothetical protein
VNWGFVVACRIGSGKRSEVVGGSSTEKRSLEQRREGFVEPQLHILASSWVLLCCFVVDCDVV